MIITRDLHLNRQRTRVDDVVGSRWKRSFDGTKFRMDGTILPLIVHNFCVRDFSFSTRLFFSWTYYVKDNPRFRIPGEIGWPKDPRHYKNIKFRKFHVKIPSKILFKNINMESSYSDTGIRFINFGIKGINVLFRNYDNGGLHHLPRVKVNGVNKET